MPTDPYFMGRTQGYMLPMVELSRPECPGDHGCCCECDRCPSLDVEYGQPEGPVQAVQFGPWPDATLSQILKARYADLDFTKLMPDSFELPAEIKRKARYTTP